MFTEYRAQVLEDYRKKKSRNELSLNLTLSTPAKLRNECTAVLSTRYSPKDERTLRLFFGPKDSAEDYEQAIRKGDIDKFRPLNNLLSNNEIRTDEKNIELLAWLIDFQPRPYRLGYVKQEDKMKPAQAGAVEDSSDETGKKESERDAVNLTAYGKTTGFEGIPEPGKKLLASKKKGALILLLIVALTGAGTYLAPTNFLASQECMYWTGDSYKPISCNEQVGTLPILALDAEKVKNFEKITHTDTITHRAVGFVWYSKIDNELEFFTSDGFHPKNDDRRLKPITEYIIDKYLKRESEISAR